MVTSSTRQFLQAETLAMSQLIAVVLSVVAVVVGFNERMTELISIGMVGLFVGVVTTVTGTFNTVNRLRLALELPAGTTFARLRCVETRLRITGKWWRLRSHRSPLVALLVLPLVIPTVACGKKDLIRVNADAITALSAAVRTADATFQAGLLSAEKYREILTSGEKARLVLIEVNRFAASLPDGQLPTAEQKAMLLTTLDAAISQFSNLVAQGVFFTDSKSRDQFYRYARPAAAAILIIKAAVIKLDTVKPSPGIIDRVNVDSMKRSLTHAPPRSS